MQLCGLRSLFYDHSIVRQYPVFRAVKAHVESRGRNMPARQKSVSQAPVSPLTTCNRRNPVIKGDRGGRTFAGDPSTPGSTGEERGPVMFRVSSTLKAGIYDLVR